MTSQCIRSLLSRCHIKTRYISSLIHYQLHDKRFKLCLYTLYPLLSFTVCLQWKCSIQCCYVLWFGLCRVYISSSLCKNDWFVWCDRTQCATFWGFAVAAVPSLSAWCWWCWCFGSRSDLLLLSPDSSDRRPSLSADDGTGAALEVRDLFWSISTDVFRQVVKRDQPDDIRAATSSLCWSSDLPFLWWFTILDFKNPWHVLPLLALIFLGLKSCLLCFTSLTGQENFPPMEEEEHTWDRNGIFKFFITQLKLLRNDLRTDNLVSLVRFLFSFCHKR